MKSSHGLSGFLALLQFMISNRLSRLFIKALLKPYKINGYEKILLDVLFQYFANNLTIEHCPLVIHFTGNLFNLWMKFALSILKTDIEISKQLLKDSAIRRGVLLIFKSISEHGITKPLSLSAPFFVVWNFTNMCNLRCLHCYQRADKPLPNELSFEEKLKVVDILDKAFVCGIALSGGEPTIHPDFLPIIYEISKRGMYAAVATNGIAFSNEEFTIKCKKAGLRYVEVSLDSTKPEIHDKFRGLVGAWEKTVQGIKNCIKHGLFVAIATTVTKMNINEAEDMIRFAQDLGVRRVVFFNFIPVGRGRDNIYLDLTPEEREEFLKQVYRASKKYKVEVVTTAPQYGRVVLQVSRGFESSPTHFAPALDWGIYKTAAEFIGGCGAGRVYCAIEPDGTITPCVFMPIPVGNIKYVKLWKENELFNKLRNRENLIGICKICKFKDVCGGCRARAYAYFGNPLADDPGCIYCRREYYKLVQEVGLEGVSKQVKKEALIWKV